MTDRTYIRIRDGRALRTAGALVAASSRLGTGNLERMREVLRVLGTGVELESVGCDGRRAEAVDERCPDPLTGRRAELRGPRYVYRVEVRCSPSHRDPGDLWDLVEAAVWAAVDPMAWGESALGSLLVTWTDEEGRAVGSTELRGRSPAD